MSGSDKTIWLMLGVAIGIAGCGPKPQAPSPEALPPVQEERVISCRERLNLARAYMDQGRIGEAAEHYREVLKQDPHNFEASLSLGIALMTMEDAKPQSERDYTETKQHFATARHINDSDPRPYFYLGMLAFKEKDYDGAIDALSVAARLDPDNESAHETLGLVLLETGKTGQAKRRLLRTLEINPANEAANFELGKVYESTGKVDVALECFNRVINTDPGFADVAERIDNINDGNVDRRGR